ncbi:MAG: hypothetical protein HZB19_09465 [Chloroflexi bacterium]|nr:hypothetical protein [Chloroflexota bacterium]
MHNKNLLIVATTLLLAIALTACGAQNATAATESAPTPVTGPISFTKDVMPIFESYSIKEGLDLKTYESLMAGSKNGSVITPGNANDSFLAQQVIDKEMPKRGPKLTPDQVQVIINWINAGALNN